MQTNPKVPVDIHKTLEDNFKMIKEQGINEICNFMLSSLSEQDLPQHLRLQYLYNVHQINQKRSLTELCNNQLEWNIVNNIKYYGQDLDQLLKQIDSPFTSISSEYLRPIPQILTPSSWEDISPQFILHPIWDYNVNPFLFRFYLIQAQSTKLSIQDQQIILTLFKSEYKIDITQFNNLVEHNPQLVSDMITKLNQSGTNVNEYLDYLIQIKVTIQTLELVNQLTKNITLPDQFLNMFITRCIVTCEEVKQNQQQLARQVRLVSVFIKTLIKQKTFNPKKIYVELQGFCLEFSTIQEATQLFKAIKNAVQEQ
ncbi:unnamed protein product [Paramecium sonneborni]|uniref:CCR4-NOT transcription complex subunit 11 n=1 Tax=Paramecium sonneborni TaxID=65129 RepID=A0A8S1QA79_9CILI|nr:unnamed protein product [Paramecium sonneborni]